MNQRLGSFAVSILGGARRWGSLPLEMSGGTRRFCRLAGEAASLGVFTGGLLGLVRWWPYLTHGFRGSALSLVAVEVVWGLIWALAATLAVTAAIGVAHVATRGSRRAAWLGLTLVATPVFLLSARWVNRHWLPGFLEPKSVAWNVAMTTAFPVLTFLLVPLLRSRWRAAGRPQARPLRAPWLLAAGLLAASLLAGAVERDTRPPVFLIVIDALRVDHLGCYGYGRATSSNLDRLARDGVLFLQAISPSTFTKTSIASLVTGLDPHKHGVYAGNVQDAAGHVTSDVLPSELETLAEGLLRGRYRTAAWIQQGHLRSLHGFAQGYVEYNEDQGSVIDITRRVIRWTREVGTTGPFFAHLHVLDLHDPYRPKPPYDRLYGSYSDVYRGIDFREWGRYLKEMRDGRRPLSRADVDQLRALYDGQITYIDHVFGRFFDQLKRAGLYDRSLIVVTADHGDGFMEHGFVSHGTSPYEELIRVPLLMKLPGRGHAGLAVKEQVRLIDVMPTVLEAVGLPPRNVTGRSLLSLLERDASMQTKQAVIEFQNGLALRDSTSKYIRFLDGRRELYHLAKDPDERRNVADEAPGEVARLEARALEILARRSALVPKRTPLDASTIEQLKALGYLR
jgi:arylsulfatase A-like enzyme